MKKAINLLELVIAIVLLALIILGTTAFDIGNRGLLDYSEDRAALINEANLVLDRITRDGAFAIGDIANPAFTNTATTLSIRQDSNFDGRLNAGDQLVTYTYNAAAHTVTRGAEVLTSKAVGFTITPIGGNPATSYTVRITLQHDPNILTRNAAGQVLVTTDELMRNPQVSVQTEVVAPAYSIH
jgi:hypothetical protein